MSTTLTWQRGGYPTGLPDEYRLLRLKLRTPDGRYKIAERIDQPGMRGYPLFEDGVHVETHRLLRDAQSAAESRVRS